MTFGSINPPSLEHAQFAVISRLISCLVTERILRAFYISFQQPIDDAVGLMVVLSTRTIAEDANSYRPFRSEDVFVMIPLHHPPVFRDLPTRKHGQLVGLVDPLDMIPRAYEFKIGEKDHDDGFVQHIFDCLQPPPWDLSSSQRLLRISDPVSLWKGLIEDLVISENLLDQIGVEIQSSTDWQALAYANPPSCPHLCSPPIEWEQSLVAGHPTHPMHRARMLPLNYATENAMDYDWYHPKIRFVRVPASQLNLLGSFRLISREMAAKAYERAGQSLAGDDFVYMPIHELQTKNIASKFKNVEILRPEIYLPALAQSSIRTVVIPDFPGIALKLAVGVKISSALRTISHFTADFGPRFSAEIVPKLAVDPRILSVELEPSSAVYRTSDPDIAKHFTAVIREMYTPPSGENVIVVAALLEMDHANVPAGVAAVQHILGLDTEKKREDFLDQYIRVACEALIPALIQNGVAFEAHAQNVLVRLDIETGKVRGFVLRDLGGLRIHPPTLRESTGTNFQFLPNHCVATNTLEEIFPKFYHTFVHNHIQRLIRVLGLHYNGRGWEMLRKHMGTVIPRTHPVWKVWMDPASTNVDSKCLMRMRMRDSYRDMVYSPYPNMIQYSPQALQAPQSMAAIVVQLMKETGVKAQQVLTQTLVAVARTIFF
ncbi:hypothetical protein HYPSUDRAFT_36546 [Hypholoma sublateritium FD-334 SS-4]|uniref:Aerobactin siderophore biosynthesis IucA/IucC N-terminal domain-containing protein n=1 Tax=Hypholoma sublateritium (strain FD-334 SS-4) TaxID=945553 RepID=A0A0D2Q3T2_HYPSF|nr:hypothetical protein HYPSUDRAFT_36546 [Hypholoma sublateritium FD-334 SS-4]